MKKHRNARPVSAPGGSWSRYGRDAKRDAGRSASIYAAGSGTVFTKLKLEMDNPYISRNSPIIGDGA